MVRQMILQKIGKNLLFFILKKLMSWQHVNITCWLSFSVFFISFQLHRKSTSLELKLNEIELKKRGKAKKGYINENSALRK